MGRRPKPENVDQQLRGAIATLDRSGGVKYFFDIKRRLPGTSLWAFWKRRVPVDDIDDVAEFCYREGGGQFEYRVMVVDADGTTPNDTEGNPIQPRTISAIESAKPTEAERVEDDEITERRKDLRRKVADLELKKEEARLAREERKLRVMIDGVDDEGEDDEKGEVEEPASYDPRLDPNSPIFNYWMAQKFGFPFGMPNGNGAQQQKPQQSDMAVLAQAMIAASQEQSKTMSTILTALLTKDNGHKESSIDQILKMKSLFPTMEPKDIMGMISPMFGEMHKLQAESSKITMQAMADNQRMMNEKMLEMMAASPDADENDIERVGKLMGVGGEVVARVINAFRGGGTKRGDKIEVPALENKKPPTRIPGPAGAGNGSPSVSPTEAAKQAVKDRVRLFLLTHEQEMLIESDPLFVVEKLAELWMSFPTSLREKLVALTVDKIYETLHEYEAEIVDRILVSVSEDKEGKRKKWALEFWEEIKTPVDDDDDDDDDGEGEPEPEPMPEPEAAEK